MVAYFVLFSSYKLRIESMLLKEEFTTNMSYLEPSISAMIVAGEGRFSKSLNYFIGNFMGFFSFRIDDAQVIAGSALHGFGSWKLPKLCKILLKKSPNIFNSKFNMCRVAMLETQLG